MNINTSDISCSICLGEVDRGVVTTCNHYFHEECIDEWFVNSLNSLNSLSCPNCRSRVYSYKNFEAISFSEVIDSTFQLFKNSVQWLLPPDMRS